MNSLKFSPKSWLFFNIGSLLLLLAVVSSSICFSRRLHSRIDTENINGVNKAIMEAVRQSEAVDSALQQVVRKYAAEIIIYNEQDGTLLFENLHQYAGRQKPGQTQIQTQMKIYEVDQRLRIAGENHHLSYTLYRAPLSLQQKIIMAGNVLISGSLMLLLLLGFFRLQRNAATSLHFISTALEKAENNEFDKLHDPVVNQDRLSQRLADLVLRQRQHLQESHCEKTTLLLNLHREKERRRKIINYSKGLVHDLKLPLHLIKVESELALAENIQDSHQRVLLETRGEMVDRFLQEVNRLLQNLKEDVYSAEYQEEDIDVVAELLATNKLLKLEMKKKGLYFFYEGPESQIIRQNRVGLELLFRNIASNMVYYSRGGTEIVVTLEVDELGVMFVTESVSDEVNIRRIQYPEAGNGLTLIQDLSESLGGTNKVTLGAEPGQVISRLFLPDRK